MGLLGNHNQHDAECEAKWGMLCAGNKHVALRWLLGLLIILFVYSLGYKMGIINERIAQDYGMYGGYPHMQKWQGWNMPMMYNQGYYSTGLPTGTQSNTGTSTQTQPTTPTQDYRYIQQPTPFNVAPQAAPQGTTTPNYVR